MAVQERTETFVALEIRSYSMITTKRTRRLALFSNVYALFSNVDHFFQRSLIHFAVSISPENSGLQEQFPSSETTPFASCNERNEVARRRLNYLQAHVSQVKISNMIGLNWTVHVRST